MTHPREQSPKALNDMSRFVSRNGIHSMIRSGDRIAQALSTAPQTTPSSRWQRGLQLQPLVPPQLKHL